MIRRDKKVSAKKAPITDNTITMVPSFGDGGICDICDGEENVNTFGVNTYKIGPKEIMTLCRECEKKCRMVGVGAFSFDKRWIPAIKELRKKKVNNEPTNN